MIRTTVFATLLIFGSLGHAAPTQSKVARSLNSDTMTLLNGLLNKRHADAQFEDCLTRFRNLEADLTSGNVVAPANEEDDWVYNLFAEKHVTGGVKRYHFKIKHFEGGYSCELMEK